MTPLEYHEFEAVCIAAYRARRAFSWREYLILLELELFRAGIRA